MCGALWEISVHDNGDEETGVQIDLPLSNTISQIRLQRPFIFQQLPQILWKAKNALLPFSFLAFLHFVLPEGGLNTTTNLNVDMSRYKKFFNKIIILLSLIKQDLVWPWSSKGGVAWPGAFKILAVLTYPPPPFWVMPKISILFLGPFPLKVWFESIWNTQMFWQSEIFTWTYFGIRAEASITKSAISMWASKLERSHSL